MAKPAILGPSPNVAEDHQTKNTMALVTNAATTWTRSSRRGAPPGAGGQVHAFARCDTARLQLEYDRPSPRALFSSCLAIPTATTLSASSTTVWIGGSTQFTASLTTTSATPNRSLASDPLSGRVVGLQRRAGGAGAWTTVGRMVQRP